MCTLNTRQINKKMSGKFTIKGKIVISKDLRFSFLTATVVSSGYPFSPETTAFHTSPNAPLPNMVWRSICLREMSQREAVNERYRVSDSLKKKNDKERESDQQIQ